VQGRILESIFVAILSVPDLTDTRIADLETTGLSLQSTALNGSKNAQLSQFLKVDLRCVVVHTSGLLSHLIVS